MSDGGSIPGWYPDPTRGGWYRWWDGRAWTGHAMPDPQAPAPTYGQPGPYAGSGYYPGGPGPSVQQVAEDERRALPWGRAAVIAWPFLLMLTSVNYVLTGRSLRLMFDWFRTTSQHAGTPGYIPPPAPHLSFYAYVGLLLWLPRIGFAIWLYRSATTARALGYPARVAPGLGGFSLLIPVVSLWMPALCMMGCLPPDHPLRGRVPWFWALYVLAGLAGTTVAVVAAFSETAGFVCLVPLAAVYLVLMAAALALQRAIAADRAAVLAAHRGVSRVS